MNTPPERTPEQLRRDRRAGIGCSGAILLAGLAFVFGGFSELSEKGELTKARIVDCNFRVIRQPDNCRGFWTTSDGEFHAGFVEGASRGDLGKQVEIRADGGDAKVVKGRTRVAVVLFVLAGTLILLGIAMGRSMLRRPVPPDR